MSHDTLMVYYSLTYTLPTSNWNGSCESQVLNNCHTHSGLTSKCSGVLFYPFPFQLIKVKQH